MTITIPTWVLWALGIPVAIAALALMSLGVAFIRFIVGMGRVWP